MIIKENSSLEKWNSHHHQMQYRHIIQMFKEKFLKENFPVELLEYDENTALYIESFWVWAIEYAFGEEKYFKH